MRPGDQHGVIQRLNIRQTTLVEINQHPRCDLCRVQAKAFLRAFDQHEFRLQRDKQLPLLHRRLERIEQTGYAPQPLRSQCREQRLRPRPADDRQGRTRHKASGMQGIRQTLHLFSHLPPGPHLPDTQVLVTQGDVRALSLRL